MSTQALLILNRRIHLYAGLFLAPWVLVYAISGFLFNHRGLTDGEPEQVMAYQRLENTALAKFPSSDALARQVCDELNARSRGANWKVESERPPRYDSSLLATVISEDGEVRSLAVDLNHQAASLTTHRVNNSPGPSKRDFADLNAFTVDTTLRSSVLRDVYALTPSKTKLMESSSRLIVPHLIFYASTDNDIWRFRYDAEQRHLYALDVRPVELRWRDFFLRLHAARGYPASTQIRTVWALVVDAVSILMCFWVLSGVIMWWQMKSVRYWGLVIILVAIVFTRILGSGMYQELTP